MKRSFIDGPFGQIHLRTWYPSQRKKIIKTPLFLIHPTTHSGNYFAGFDELMAKDREVIAMDSPGFGQSAPTSRLPSIQDFAKAAGAVLKAEGFDAKGSRPQIDVLGSHTGALTATELAIRNPKLIRRVIFAGVPFLTGQDRKTAYQRNVIPYILNYDGSHIMDRWKSYSYAMDAGVSLERIQQHFGDLMQAFPNSWKGYHAAFSYESEKRIPNMSQSALLISTAGSLQEETKAAANLYPNASHIHLEEYPSSMFDLAPEHITKLAKKFLDSKRT